MRSLVALACILHGTVHLHKNFYQTMIWFGKSFIDLKKLVRTCSAARVRGICWPGLAAEYRSARPLGPQSSPAAPRGASELRRRPRECCAAERCAAACGAALCRLCRALCRPWPERTVACGTAAFCAGPGRTRQSKAAALHPTCSVSGAGVAPLHPTCRGSGFTPRLPSHGRTATRPRPRCWSWPPSSHGEAECGPRGPYVASAKRELGHGVTPLKSVRHEGRATPG